MPTAVLLDLDGTLVDSVYQHTIAWDRALVSLGKEVPVWELHRRVGMGGDQFVPSVCGEEWDAEHGDDARDAQSREFARVRDEVRVMPGARELLGALHARGHELVLASSAAEEDLEHFLDLLGARDLLAAWTSSEDVEETKPAPEIFDVALERIGGGPAVVVGDAPYDIEAAGRCGVPAIGLLCGGFGEAELRESGAVAVFASLDALREDLDSTPLALDG
jgi:HAD superfamily hydrolase (TIGR01509 family)